MEGRCSLFRFGAAHARLRALRGVGVSEVLRKRTSLTALSRRGCADKVRFPDGTHPHNTPNWCARHRNKEQSRMEEQYDEATAYHEAGHAVAALVLGRPIQRVSIQPDREHLGQCELGKGVFRPSEDWLEN